MRRWPRLLVALCLLLAAAAAQAQLFKRAASSPETPIVEVLDIGQGDAILIRSPEGKVALVDAGPSKEVVSVLKQRGVTSIDIVVLSHHHSDHYGGMSEVIRTFHPKYFMATNSGHTTSAYLKLLKLVKENEMQVVQPKSTPRKIEVGSITLTVFPQAPENQKEENENSIGIRLQYGKFSMLMTGDSEERERAWWVHNNPELIKDCTVLKLAHHGSRNGTNSEWLDLVKPKLTVASLAAGNDYHHPHTETVSLLAKEGIPFLRTDRSGTVVIYSDGKSWRVEETKGGMASINGGSSDASQPSRKRRSAWAGSEAKPQAKDTRININTASQEELLELPGVGESTAQKIIKARPFKSLDDLSRVRGISEARIAQIRSEVIVR